MDDRRCTKCGGLSHNYHDCPESLPGFKYKAEEYGKVKDRNPQIDQHTRGRRVQRQIHEKKGGTLHVNRIKMGLDQALDKLEEIRDKYEALILVPFKARESEEEMSLLNGILDGSLDFIREVTNLSKGHIKSNVYNTNAEQLIILGGKEHQVRELRDLLVRNIKSHLKKYKMDRLSLF